MVRFSCFNGHIHSHKPKKTVDSSFEAMHKTLQDSPQIQAPNKLFKDISFNSSLLKGKSDVQLSESSNVVSSSVYSGQGWKSEKTNSKFNIDSDTGVYQRRLLKKSQSFGGRLCHKGRVPCENDTEDGVDHEFSSGSLDQNGLAGPDGSKEQGVSPTRKHQKPLQSDSIQVGSDIVNNESIFSIGDFQNSEKEGPENSDTVLSGEGANDSSNQTPRTHHIIVKSCSSPNLGLAESSSVGCSYKRLASHSRSSEDLNVLDMRRKDISLPGVEAQEIPEQERDDNAYKTEKTNFEISADDGYDSYTYSALAKDWIVPVTDDLNSVKNIQGESSTQCWDELPSKDFKIKRIEEWVSDLQHCSTLEETNEVLDTNDSIKRDSAALNGLNAAKADSKVSPGMEAAKRYISSLSASATTAQLSNHGLVVIPFLSAFVSLKVLNLSGNSIVRITAGALPRGLHVLNLSKNSISAIEGLRELTRLRVLDLSYNRILKIGHGLASCSSLKELYLAGNKVSEVEGLHRLLKLTVLDLRFNKISTAKCLGQLAANYNSLQAISLEGNPAQKNVGDEQLKKYLLGLLPHLVYFNRQPIKASTLKDAADRSVRLGIRSDNKTARKASHGAGTRPSSATHGRKCQAVVSPKRSRTRHAHLPPVGTKGTTNHRHNYYYDFGSRLLNLRSELSIRRSRSEGTLGVV